MIEVADDTRAAGGQAETPRSDALNNYWATAPPIDPSLRKSQRSCSRQHVYEFSDALTAAGFTDIEIRETHRVHEHAGSAIIRASLPG